MNKLRKVGLTALAASLATVSSVTAGELSVTGSASVLYNTKENANSSGWETSDKINFLGSGDLGNGMSVTVGMNIDESDRSGDSTEIFDEKYVTVSSDLGSLTLHGNAGSTVIAATDDKMPTVYEESWYPATGPGKGSSKDNFFYYSSAGAFDGFTLDVSYAPGGNGDNAGSTEAGVTFSAIDGLTVGVAMGTDKGAINNEVDSTNIYATYAMGPMTFGVQRNDNDAQTVATDTEFTAVALSYAVSDDLTVSVARSEVDYETGYAGGTADQEATAIGASYTMGSTSIALQTFDIDNNNGGTAANDSYRAWELNVAFAF